MRMSGIHANRMLAPAILFGLIMALSFACTISVAEAGRWMKTSQRPSPMASIAITEQTPNTMPSMVSNERRRCSQRLLKPRRIVRRSCEMEKLWITGSETNSWEASDNQHPTLNIQRPTSKARRIGEKRKAKSSFAKATADKSAKLWNRFAMILNAGEALLVF